jgi:hypothetical protein
MAPTHIIDQVPRGQEAGAWITELFRRGGEGARVWLRSRAVFELRTTIELTHDGQELATLECVRGIACSPRP